MEQTTLAQKIAGILNDKKAKDISVLHVAHLTVITDYMVIASGRSSLQVKALADEVDDAMAMEGVQLRSKEGNAEGRRFQRRYARRRNLRRHRKDGVCRSEKRHRRYGRYHR